ncbi:MAG TPA: ROK family protein [Abditibacteriaceae bacterium]|jgi:glucokinase
MANHFVSVDVGGTKILGAVVSETGRIVVRHKEKTDRRSKKRLVEQICEVIESCLKAADLSRADIAGIALGVPGVVDGRSGHVVLTPNAPLSDTPLGQTLRVHFGLPVAVGNDASLGILGEQWRGAARRADSAFGIFVGTGIGGGLIIGGKLIDGFRGLGGEIGHLMVPLGADEIAGMLTRKHLFLEDLCSRTAIENQLRHAIQKDGKKTVLTEIIGDKKLERIRSGALKEALRRKDPLVTDVMRRSSYLLGLATASVLHVVDPEIIIFGGGVIEACGDFMLPLIEKTAHKVAMPGTGRPLQIVRSELGDDAILYGGVALLKSVEPHLFAAPVVPKLPAAKGRTRKIPAAKMDKPLK